MRTLRLALLLASTLLVVTSASAQPDDYVTGTFKLALTVNNTRYKMPVGGYRITSTIIQGDSVPIVNVWIAIADVQAVGLPSGATIKGKEASRTRFFQQTAEGVYQKIIWNAVRIAGVASSSGGLVLQLQLGAEDVELLTAQETGSNSEPGRRLIPFTGKAQEIGAADWD